MLSFGTQAKTTARVPSQNRESRGEGEAEDGGLLGRHVLLFRIFFSVPIFPSCYLQTRFTAAAVCEAKHRTEGILWLCGAGCGRKPVSAHGQRGSNLLCRALSVLRRWPWLHIRSFFWCLEFGKVMVLWQCYLCSQPCVHFTRRWDYLGGPPIWGP